MVSTRTFFFETKASNEKLLNELLFRWLGTDCRPLRFFKFIVYYSDKTRKISGILQFKQRYSVKTLRLCFTPEGVHMDILRPVETLDIGNYAVIRPVKILCGTKGILRWRF